MSFAALKKKYKLLFRATIGRSTIGCFRIGFTEKQLEQPRLLLSQAFCQCHFIDISSSNKSAPMTSKSLISSFWHPTNAIRFVAYYT